MDLSGKGDRARLKIRRAPYWQRLAKGRYLGFRRGPDIWQARFRDRKGEQRFQSLGEGLDFDEAKKAAEAWFALMGGPVRSARRGTVTDALESYLKWLEDQGRQSTAKTCRDRFELIVWADPIADIQLSSLTLDDMLEWRDRLKDGREPRSVNRHVRSIVAGLNKARTLGHIGNPDAWKLEPLADNVEESGETAVLLDATQRKAIIAAADPLCALFLRGLELTGGRPKELAEAVVADFDKRSGTLTLRHKKGRPAKVRTRAVVLSADGIKFFAQQARGKTPQAPIFIGPSGGHWDRYQWSKATRAAVDAVNETARKKNRIPVAASAYSFRHARISELLQIHGVDPVTVALQTGTSVAMIEKAYFKFAAPALREKLAAIEEA